MSDDNITIFKPASYYDINHYEKSYKLEFYRNVSIYAISLKKHKSMSENAHEYIIFSADVKNIIGIGDTEELAKTDFLVKIYNNINNELGGIYLLSSDFYYHEMMMKNSYLFNSYISINHINDIILFPTVLPLQ